jgi:serine/threonine protein kinase
MMGFDGNASYNPPHLMTLVPGAKLGPYVVVGSVGAGGMGEVYRARDTRLERTVAIKVLSAHLSSNPDLKQRFEREARAISALQHPHICTLFDIGEQDGTDFLVMEYLEGETLADRLSRGALPLKDVLRIGLEIADGLDNAHRAGIVHRDLKPGNIMLSNGSAKLLDFGLAKALALPSAVTGTAAMGANAPTFSAAMTMSSPSPQLSPITTQGAIVGTIQYMSRSSCTGWKRMCGQTSSPWAQCSMRWQADAVRLKENRRSALLLRFWRKTRSRSRRFSLPVHWRWIIWCKPAWQKTAKLATSQRTTWNCNCAGF